MPLFAFGSNGSGQLGIGHDEDVSTPTRCLFEDQTSLSSSRNYNIRDSDIVRIVAGGNHTLLLYQDGTVFAAGCNEDGRCGQNSATGSLKRFKRVAVMDVDDGDTTRCYDTFKNVSATWEGTFFVTGSSDDDEDKVFVLGSGAKGELGLGQGCVQAVTPVRIPKFPPEGTKIVSISSGMGHTVVGLSNGEMYGWGGARKGQLGDSVKDQKIVWSPTKIEGVPFYATDSACGREFTIITGSKAAGEFVILGSSDNKWNILSDTPASGVLAGYLSISASWHGVYVHQRDFSVIAWGRNDRGQLPPAELPKATKLAVGSEHALALLDERNVVAFGWGEHGNCGPITDAQGNIKGTYTHIPFRNEEGSHVIGIGAGCATSWIVTS